MSLNSFIEQARNWKSDGMDWNSIREKLAEQGVDENLASEAVSIVRKEVLSKNRNIGMILLGIGSLLCAFSMVYTYLFGHNYFMLYGLTMIGVSVAFAGLVYVMG